MSIEFCPPGPSQLSGSAPRLLCFACASCWQLYCSAGTGRLPWLKSILTPRDPFIYLAFASPPITQRMELWSAFLRMAEWGSPWKFPPTPPSGCRCRQHRPTPIASPLPPGADTLRHKCYPGEGWALGALGGGGHTTWVAFPPLSIMKPGVPNSFQASITWLLY